MNLLLGFVLGSALLGCGGELLPVEVEQEYLLEPRPIDVLWVIDNSSSMEEAQFSLGAAFPSLLSELSQLGLDWQMAIVTTDMSDPEARGRLVEVAGDGSIVLTPLSSDLESRFALRVRVGTEGSQVERGLESSWAAVTPPLSTHDNLGFLRDEARLALVVASDDEDCSHEGGLSIESSEACAADPAALVPVSDYLVRYEGLKDDPLDVSLHALVETGATEEFTGCGGATPGTRIIAAARATGGSVLPLCEDFDASLSELGRQLTGRRTAFPLRRVADSATIEVFIDPTELLGQPPESIPEDRTMENGWTYHAGSNSVRLWGEAIPVLGDTVRIRYSVAPGG